MTELRAVRRLRQEIEPLDDASFARIWSDIVGQSADEDDLDRLTKRELVPTFDLDRSPALSRKRWLLTAAAAALVVAGMGAVAGVRILTEESGPSAPAASPTTATAPNLTASPVPVTAVQYKLRLPAQNVEPTYVQHNAGVQHRIRGLVRALDGSTLSVNVMENCWGELPADMEQRDLAGLTWATAIEDTNRAYVTVDTCTMLALNAGADAPAWDANAVALMNGVQFADQIAINLPDGWQTIEIGRVGDWYSMSYDPAIEGVPGVTLTQMPGSTAGPLLADFAGRTISAITIDKSAGWQVPLDEDGWTQTIWQNDSGAMMLTSKGLSLDRIDQLISELTPATASDWATRYGDQGAGTSIATAEPACEPTTLLIPSPGA